MPDAAGAGEAADLRGVSRGLYARVAAAACECSTWNNFAWNGAETEGAGPAGEFEWSGWFMIELPPHPIFKLPAQETLRAIERQIGREQFTRRLQVLVEELQERIQAELEQPFERGYRPPIWYVADELLEEGKEVVLVDPAWDITDPEIRKRRPLDFLEEAIRRRQLGLGPIVIVGQRELWIAGSNRSSKTEYAARKTDEIGVDTPHGRTWSWSDSEDKSRAKQHPIIFKYLPTGWKQRLNEKGKAKSVDVKMGYGPDGFIGNKFTCENGWKHWFNNYKQDLRDVEGDQLDLSWHDEERDPERIKTVRVRLGDRRGLLLNTFTSIDATFTAMVSEYESGMQILLEVEAEWLLKDKRAGELTPYERRPGRRYEKVRRVAVAGPGSDGDQKANIVYFHIGDNPYYGYNPHQRLRAGEKPPIYGKRAFYINQNIANATRNKILSRAYGILTSGASRQFNFNTAVHMIAPDQVPRRGTRYLVVDPCPGRNWFMSWLLIDPHDNWFVYREWPSYGGDWPSAYIPGIGDPGPWALAGATRPGTNKTVYDGVKGPAQEPFKLGLNRYKEEIERVEAGEEIQDRWMDARYAGSPTTTKEAQTTYIEQLQDIGLEFLASPSEQNMLTIDDGSIAMINQRLEYDPDVDLGKYSARLARLNQPKLFVSTECPNVRFALKEWTGKDGQHGACKDPADTLRYAALCDLGYIGEGMFSWSRSGGSY